MDTQVSLDHALQRFSHDARRRAFYSHPAILELVRENQAAWTESLVQSVADGSYVPQPARLVWVPKPAWHVRAGTVLRIEDEVVYSYLGLQLLPTIREIIDWSAPSIRYSHRLAAIEKKYWFSGHLAGWKAFDRISTLRLSQDGASYVVVADIAGFYDNISLERLLRELISYRAHEPACRLLSKCLHKWAQQRGRGIPQGHSTSDLLAELMLDPLDRALSHYGIDHLRYNDDIRIFARSEREARAALRELTKLLHERGLNLQSAKTQIIGRNEAMQRFSHVATWLSGIGKRLQTALEHAGTADYISPSQLGELLRSDVETPAPRVVEAAWDDFVAQNGRSFDKSVFHYLINRLGDMGSPRAVEYCVRTLSLRPEETAQILLYFTRLAQEDRPVGAVASLLHSVDTVSEYQKYEIVRWAWEQRIRHEVILDFARRALADAHTILGGQSLLYLGRFGGQPADIDALQRVLTQSTDADVPVLAAYALATAPSIQKRPILARARGQSRTVDWAIDYALVNTG